MSAPLTRTLGSPSLLKKVTTLTTLKQTGQRVINSKEAPTRTGPKEAEGDGVAV